MKCELFFSVWTLKLSPSIRAEESLLFGLCHPPELRYVSQQCYILYKCVLQDILLENIYNGVYAEDAQTNKILQGRLLKDGLFPRAISIQHKLRKNLDFFADKQLLKCKECIKLYFHAKSTTLLYITIKGSRFHLSKFNKSLLTYLYFMVVLLQLEQYVKNWL